MFRSQAIKHSLNDKSQRSGIPIQSGEENLLLAKIEGMQIFLAFDLKQVITLKKNAVFHKLPSAVDYFLGLAHVGIRSIPVIDIKKFFVWLEEKEPLRKSEYYTELFQQEDNRRIDETEEKRRNALDAGGKKTVREYKYVLVEFEDTPYLLTGLEIMGIIDSSAVMIREDKLMFQREGLFSQLFVISSWENRENLIALSFNSSQINEMIRNEIIEDSTAKIRISSPIKKQSIGSIKLEDPDKESIERFFTQAEFRKSPTRKDVLHQDQNLFIFFRIQNFKFAIKLENVISLIKRGRLQRNIALNHPFIRGIVFTNNSNIFVIDSEILISPKSVQKEQDFEKSVEIIGQIIVLTNNSDESHLGVIVDEVLKIGHLEPRAKQQEVFPFASKTSESYISGVYWEKKEPIYILNFDMLSKQIAGRKLPVWSFPLDTPFAIDDSNRVEKEIVSRKDDGIFLPEPETELFAWFKRERHEFGIPIKNIVYFWHSPPIAGSISEAKTNPALVFNGKITPIFRLEDIFPLGEEESRDIGARSVIIFENNDPEVQSNVVQYFGILINEEISIGGPPPISPLMDSAVSTFVPDLFETFSVVGIRHCETMTAESNHFVGIINENWLRKEVLRKIGKDFKTADQETVLKKFRSLDPVNNYYFSWLFETEVEMQHMLLFELGDDVIGALEASHITEYVGTEKRFGTITESPGKEKILENLFEPFATMTEVEVSPKDKDYVLITEGKKERIIGLPKLLGIETFNKKDLKAVKSIMGKISDKKLTGSSNLAIIARNKEWLEKNQRIIEGVILPSQKFSFSIGLEGKIIVVFKMSEILSRSSNRQPKNEEAKNGKSSDM